MAKSASNLVFGSIIEVEVGPSGSSAYTSSGLINPEVTVTWEGEGQETSDGQMIPTTGLGTITVTGIQTKGTDIGLIESASTALYDVRLTDIDGNQQVVSGVYLRQTYNKINGPEADKHTYIGQRRTRKIGDFISLVA